MERGAYIILYQLERRTPSASAHNTSASDGGGVWWGRIWWYRVPSGISTKIEKKALITEVGLL